jgi:hypothetical protein
VAAVDHFGNSAAGEPHQVAFAAATADALPTAAMNASATTDLASFNARFVFGLASGGVADLGGDKTAAWPLPAEWVQRKGAREPLAHGGAAAAL